MSIMEKLAEELGPEPDWAIMDDDIREMKRGSRLRAETSIRLKSQPVKEQLYADILVQFMWGLGSIKNQQRGLTQAFSDEPVLQEKYAGFLQAPIETEKHRAKAAEKLCAIIGIPFQTPLPKNAILWSEGVFLSTAEDRLGPSIFTASDFIDVKVGRWNDGVARDDVYSKLELLLTEQPDILSQLQIVWHGWDYQMRD